MRGIIISIPLGILCWAIIIGSGYACYRFGQAFL